MAAEELGSEMQGEDPGLDKRFGSALLRTFYDRFMRARREADDSEIMVDIPYKHTRERFPLAEGVVARDDRNFNVTFPRIKRLPGGRTEKIETTVVLPALALATAVYFYKKGKR